MHRNLTAIIIVTCIFVAVYINLSRKSINDDHHHLPTINKIKHQIMMTTTSYEEYVKKDYRAFLFAIHPAHGMLLLYCTCKKKKGPHYQCPGGHVDREDYAIASRIPQISSLDLLTLGCKIGVARELYEETGIDIRSTLEDRVQPVRLREDDSSDDNRVVGEFKERLFFRLNLEDGDFVSTGLDSSSNVLQSLNKTPPHLMVSLLYTIF